MFNEKDINQIRKNSKVKECVWCNSKSAISSHFIQKKKLKEISYNGKVFQINLKKSILEGIGCKKATILTAFCPKHDKKLFQRIEDNLYDKLAIQNLLFFIRNTSKELHLVKEWHKSISNFKEIKEHPEIKRYNYSYSYLEPRFQLLKSIHSIADIEEKVIARYIKTINITLPYFVGFLFSKAIIYKNCFLSNHNLPLISIDIIKQGEKTEIIVSYFNDSEKDIKDFLEKLTNKNQDEALLFLSSIVLEHSPNLFFSKNYIDKLKKEEQRFILEYSLATSDIRLFYVKNYPYNVLNKKKQEDFLNFFCKDIKDITESELKEWSPYIYNKWKNLMNNKFNLNLFNFNK